MLWSECSKPYGPLGMLKWVVGKGKSSVAGPQSLCVWCGAFGMREKANLLKGLSYPSISLRLYMQNCF